MRRFSLRPPPLCSWLSLSSSKPFSPSDQSGAISKLHERTNLDLRSISEGPFLSVGLVPLSLVHRAGGSRARPLKAHRCSLRHVLSPWARRAGCCPGNPVRLFRRYFIFSCSQLLDDNAALNRNQPDRRTQGLEVAALFRKSICGRVLGEVFFPLI